MNIQAFLAIENGLARRLQRSWKHVSRNIYAQVDKALAAKDYAYAHDVANNVDVSAIFDDNSQYVRYSLYSAMLFGASHLNSDLKTSAVSKGLYDDKITKVTEMVRNTILVNMENQVRKKLNEMIEDRVRADPTQATGPRETVVKYDENEPRDDHGRWTVEGATSPRIASYLGKRTASIDTLIKRWYSGGGDWTHYQQAARFLLGARGEFVPRSKVYLNGAKAMLEAINNAPVIDKPMFRGLSSTHGFDNVKVGDKFSESLTSWTGKEPLAEQFASNYYGSHAIDPEMGESEIPDHKGDVVLMLTGRNMKGISVSERADPSARIIKEADEWLTSGEYEITGMYQHRSEIEGVYLTPAPGTRVITVKRVGNAKGDNVKKQVKKYDPDEPRDERGRWTTGGASSPDGEPAEMFRPSRLSDDEINNEIKRQGLEGTDITISDEVKTFVVDGVTRNTAGEAFRDSKRIVLYRNAMDRDSMPGVIAHEAMHTRFNYALEAKAEESRRVMDDPRDVMRPDGTIRDGTKPPDHGNDYTKEYPVLTLLSGLELDWSKLEKSDGVSEYSRAWWNDATAGKVGPTTAIHETLAEINRLTYEYRGEKSPIINERPAPEWKRLYKAVNQVYTLVTGHKTPKFTKKSEGDYRTFYFDDDWNLVSKEEATLIKLVYDNGDTKFLVPQSVQKADRVLLPFQSFQDAGDYLLQLISSLHTSRVSNFGFTAEAAAKGVTRYEITEQLDNRTCPVCEVMDGQQFDVVDARSSLDTILATNDPQDLETLQPWPSQKASDISEMALMTPDELVARNWHFPPYHPWCRGLLTAVATETPTTEEPLTLPDIELTDEEQDDIIEDLEAGGSEREAIDELEKMTEEDFHNLGISASQSDVDNWNEQVAANLGDIMSAFFDDDIIDLMDQINEGGDIGLDAFKWVTGSDLVVKLNADIFGAEVDASMAFNFEDSEVTINSLLADDNLDSVRLLASWNDAWDEMGIDTVKLDVSSAEETAGAWAKYGFVAEDWDALRESIDLSSVKDSISEDAYNLLESALNSSDPEALWILADMTEEVNGVPVGELLLQGKEWTGILDRTNTDAMNRFDLYA